ncbi:hypothetical protein SSX86_015065 [Deinandra increscens subsp. villosa]|uniref:Uncharacterized protein n=1 Tax=Deinandra increscens subsp. villosa TaxID=3103831 RepID=A0AAP0D6M3_9ASTR
MRKSGGAGKKQQRDAIDEVEELLKSTEDDLLLKLTVNSHIKSKSKPKFDLVPESSRSNAIDPDLDHRFQALRSKSNPKTKVSADHEDVDTLFARFAALKGPNTKSASNSTTEDTEIEKNESCGIANVKEEEDEEDEVQKIINWAIDAARLDPSPTSEIDDSEEEEDEDSDEDSGTVVARKKKGSKK